MGANPYFFMFGRDLIFESRVQHLREVGLDQDATTEPVPVFLEERGQAFKRVMLLAMKNLVIA